MRPASMRPDQPGGTNMASASALSPQMFVVSDDAARRIATAKRNDIAFVVRKIAQSPLTNDDVQMLADLLHEALEGGKPLSRAIVERRLLERGRSPAKAKQLSSSIFK